MLRRLRLSSRILFARLAIVALLFAAPVTAQPVCAPFDDAGCAARPQTPSRGVPPAPTTAPAPTRQLLFFWGVGCPHCDAAKPALQRLAASHPGWSVEQIEVRQSAEGRARFLSAAARLGVNPPGIPLFVAGDRWVLGYQGDATLASLQALLRDQAPRDELRLPLVGDVDPARVSLLRFTVLVGLLDGLNPCAFYVLVVLLGILLHVRERARIALYGATFVVMSGVVYFIFMTAWLNAFALLGAVAWITRGLGLALLVMGLINLKDLVWFKGGGVSLMIPARAKPALFRRMRAIAQSARLPAAFAGIAALALVVNLVELGCTLGLPAMYTHVLSRREGLSAGARYAWLALYNVAYVVPLAAIVAAYAITLKRVTMTEARARVLKGVSGALLVGFGLVFLLAPQWLRG